MLYQFECQCCSHYWNTEDDRQQECPECRSPASDLSRYPQYDGKTDWSYLREDLEGQSDLETEPHSK